MKLLLTEFISICIFLLIVTQVLMPLFIPKLEMFWFFKKDKPKPTVAPPELRDRVDRAKAEVTDLRDSVNSYHKEAEELKDKTDNI